VTSGRVGTAITLGGGAAIAAATLVPEPGASPIPYFCVACGRLDSTDAVLNVLLFIPFGLGLAIRNTHVVKAILIVVFTTALVELLQLTVILGRSATLGDIVTNTIGGSIGFMAGRHWRSIVYPATMLRRVLLALATLEFAALIVLTGFSVQPSPTTGTFFGHHARPYRNEPPFPGKVHSSYVGECRVTDETIEPYSCIGPALVRGESVTVAVSARGTTASPSAIVQVVDERQNEILRVGADRDKATFSVRTRAAQMRLRPYRFAVDSVFASDGLQDVHIVGSFSPSEATITASGSRSRHATFRVGPASGWKLFIPLRYYDDGSFRARAVDAFWLALLVFPIGYWSMRSGSGGPSLLETLLVGTCIIGALLTCPLFFGTARPSITEMVVCMGGIAAGACSRRATAVAKTYLLPSPRR
jgi:hypothetical protein